jgi:hypothetical protein
MSEGVQGRWTITVDPEGEARVAHDATDTVSPVLGWRAVPVVPCDEAQGYLDRAERAEAALLEIQRLWTDPAPAQRQDVAYQKVVRIASAALRAAEADVLNARQA